MTHSHSFIRWAALAALATTSVAQGQTFLSDWKKSAGLNFALAKGNTDNMLFSGDLRGEKKWDKNELLASADFTYGNADFVTRDRTTGNILTRDNRTTAQNYGAQLHYNRLIDDRWYSWGDISYRTDRIANIDYRLALSAGIGYYFIKNERTQLSAEVGPGVVFEKVGNDDKKYMTLRFAEKFRHQLSPTARIFQNLEFLPQINKWENYVLNGDIGVEAKLTEKMNATITFFDTYRSRPAPGLKKNDMRLMAGVRYTF